jgi:hypothetical protein
LGKLIGPCELPCQGIKTAADRYLGRGNKFRSLKILHSNNWPMERIESALASYALAAKRMNPLTLAIGRRSANCIPLPTIPLPIRRVFDNSQLIERFAKWPLICGKSQSTQINYEDA